MLLGSSPPKPHSVFITLTPTSSKKSALSATKQTCGSTSSSSATASATVTMFPTSAVVSNMNSSPPLHHRRSNRFNEPTTGLVQRVSQLTLNELDAYNENLTGNLGAGVGGATISVEMTTTNVFPIQSPPSSGYSSAQSSPELIAYGSGSNLCKKSKRPANKRVAFADDHGFQLVTIRIMTEPSDVPPLLTNVHLNSKVSFYGGTDVTPTSPVSTNNRSSSKASTSSSDPEKPTYAWTPSFKPPASDYLAFRQKVDSKHVALENVIVKNDQRRLAGTVKVKNVSFEKHVILRVTADEWATYEDFEAKYKQPITKKLLSPTSSLFATSAASNGNRSPELFDTFEFHLDLPKWENRPNANDTVVGSPPPPPPPQQPKRLQFCVCYRTSDGGEYWDNNNGANFTLEYQQRYPEKQEPTISSPNGSSLSAVKSSSPTNRMSPTKGASSSRDSATATATPLEQPIKSRPAASSSSFPTFHSGRCGTASYGGNNQDAFTMSMTNWTQFSSWNHLSTEGPYW